jgi:hypothetical protein
MRKFILLTLFAILAFIQLHVAGKRQTQHAEMSTEKPQQLMKMKDLRRLVMMQLKERKIYNC